MLINSSTPHNIASAAPQSAPAHAVHIVARSHSGRVRPNNEDAIGFVAQDGIAVLADGMGGLNAGEVASRHAVDLMLQGLSAGLPMEQAVVDANRTIFNLSQSDPELHNMGTTLVALRCVGRSLWMANVGDSRIYRYRAGELTQLTTDHSVVQQMVDSGIISPEEARVAPNRNIITRALGIEARVEVDVLQDEVADNDLYMLCSDGVTDMLSPDELAGLFATYSSSLAAGSPIQPLVSVSADSESNRAGLVDAIVQAANDAGGVDNISVVLVHLSAPEVSRS